jgi:EmrB/QacA subfamily drug resistance transporter
MSAPANKNLTLFITTLAAFLTPFMASSVNVALPLISQQLGMNAILLSWVVTAYMLSAAVFLVPFGRIADIYGRKKVFLYGLIIFTFASILAAISSSALMLIFSRALQGIGGALTFGTGTAILISVYPFSERGKVLGINIGAVYLGLSLGPFLGGILTQYFGWQSIFLVNVPLGLIVIALTIWKMKEEWIECRDEKLDIGGSIIYGLTLLLVMYGLSILPKLFGFILIVLGAVGIWLLITREEKVPYPILNVNLFKKNITFAFSNLAAAINYSATSAVGFLLSLYLQNIKGLNPKDAGLVLVSQPIVMAIFSPLAGRLSDKIEPRITASIGMAFSFIGLLLLVPLNAHTHLGFITFNLIILGFGFALFSSPNTNAIMSSVDKKFYGVASGTLATMRMIGQMFSMGIAMLLFSIIMGRVKITPEYYTPFLTSIKVAFSIFALLCFGGIFASLARGKLR